MKKVNSITLLLMGIGLMPVALFIGNPILQALLLIASISLNIAAIIKNFKEKKKGKF